MERKKIKKAVLIVVDGSDQFVEDGWHLETSLPKIFQLGKTYTINLHRH